MAVAIRREDGTITSESRPFTPPLSFAANVPFVRGPIALAAAFILAVRSSRMRRRLATNPAGSRRAQILTMALPGIAVSLLDRLVRGNGPRHVRRGPVRALTGALLPLVGFRVAGLFPPVNTLLRYHAAEHMAVNAVEAGLPPTSEKAALQSRIHPRCGTTFAALGMTLAGLAGRRSARPSLVRSLLGGAVVASVAYELLRFGAGNQTTPWVRVVFAPFWQAQRLTTSPPATEHLEVACAALSAVIAEGAGETPPPALV
jgi:uncharacterized protein YqhQ